VVTKHHPTPEERDERVIVNLPPELAIAAFLAVDPSSDPADREGANPDNDDKPEH
jgi:hypothetical protein